MMSGANAKPLEHIGADALCRLTREANKLSKSQTIRFKGSSIFTKFRRWPYKYCVLTRDYLYIFDDNKSKRASLYYALTDFESVQQKYEKENVYRFKVKQSSPKHDPLLFECDTENDMLTWIKKLGKAIQEAVDSGISVRSVCEADEDLDSSDTDDKEEADDDPVTGYIGYDRINDNDIDNDDPYVNEKFTQVKLDVKVITINGARPKLGKPPNTYARGSGQHGPTDGAGQQNMDLLKSTGDDNQSPMAPMAGSGPDIPAPMAPMVDSGPESGFVNVSASRSATRRPTTTTDNQHDNVPIQATPDHDRSHDHQLHRTRSLNTTVDEQHHRQTADSHTLTLNIPTEESLYANSMMESGFMNVTDGSDEPSTQPKTLYCPDNQGAIVKDVQHTDLSSASRATNEPVKTQTEDPVRKLQQTLMAGLNDRRKLKCITKDTGSEKSLTLPRSGGTVPMQSKSSAEHQATSNKVTNQKLKPTTLPKPKLSRVPQTSSAVPVPNISSPAPVPNTSSPVPVPNTSSPVPVPIASIPVRVQEGTQEPDPTQHTQWQLEEEPLYINHESETSRPISGDSSSSDSDIYENCRDVEQLRTEDYLLGGGRRYNSEEIKAMLADKRNGTYLVYTSKDTNFKNLAVKASNGANIFKMYQEEGRYCLKSRTSLFGTLNLFITYYKSNPIIKGGVKMNLVKGFNAPN